jgi:hypothetical protein
VAVVATASVGSVEEGCSATGSVVSMVVEMVE